MGARIVAHLDPDGAEPDETEPATPSRELSLRRKRSGVWELNGRFDDETGIRASALLDSLAQRRTTDEGPDFRSPQERYGDAFSDAIDLALNTPELPMQAGERAHVMIAVSLEDLKSGVGRAILGDTGTISAAEARIHACDCKLIPAVLGDEERTPRPRPPTPLGHHPTPPRALPARPRLRLPRLPPPTPALSGSPHPPLGRWRPDRAGQPGADVRSSPPAAAPLRLAGPHRRRRITRVPATGVPGQAPKTQAQQPPRATAVRSLTRTWERPAATGYGPTPTPRAVPGVALVSKKVFGTTVRPAADRLPSQPDQPKTGGLARAASRWLCGSTAEVRSRRSSSPSIKVRPAADRLSLQSDQPNAGGVALTASCLPCGSTARCARLEVGLRPRKPVRRRIVCLRSLTDRTRGRPCPRRKPLAVQQNP